jgi:leucine dehydrogenase
MLQSHNVAEKPARTGDLTIREFTAEAAGFPGFAGHEQVLLGEDPDRGLRAIVAIHDTRLGSALGGTRIWKHESFDTALSDVLRLSHGMTLKAAISGLPFGGGKAVIIADPGHDKTPALLAAYADMLAALAKTYITAEDVGMTLADADFLRARALNVTGTTEGGSGNPAPFTAEGVFLGLKAAVRHEFGADDIAGLRVAVQGLGSVGWSLCEKLHAEGARLVVADIDANRVESAVTEFGARKTSPDTIAQAATDVFAPCALGGVLSKERIPLLPAKVIAGSANNQLATADDARRLAERGIVYAPDFVINAGGLINVAQELAPGGYDRAKAEEAIARIPQTLKEVLNKADETGKSTDTIARDMALARIESPC